jgi:hypothetical protein
MSQYDADVEDLEWFDRTVRENVLRVLVTNLERKLLMTVNAEEEQHLKAQLKTVKEALSLYDKENDLINLRAHLVSRLKSPLAAQASQQLLSQIQSIDQDLSEVQLEMQLIDMSLRP